MRSRVRALVFAVGIVLACGPVSPAPSSSLPINACPEHPCSAFVQTGEMASCTGGACQVIEGGSGNWTLVVTLAQDAYYAAGATFALSFSTLLTGASAQLPTCASSPTCSFFGFVDVTRQGAVDAKWYLGNADLTVLPVDATFWPLWSSGSSLVDAAAVGLPLGPVTAPTQPERSARTLSTRGPLGRSVMCARST